MALILELLKSFENAVGLLVLLFIGACVEAAPTQRIDQNRLMHFEGCHKI